MVQVGEHDVGQLELEQIDLLAQDQSEQEIEGPAEDFEVELQSRDRHRQHGSDQRGRAPLGAPTPMRSRTSASVTEAISRARSAPRASVSSSAASSPRSSA